MRQMRRIACGLTLICLAYPATDAAAKPRIGKALGTTLVAPLIILGDLGGGLGLVSASIVGLAGDSIAAIDDNRITHPVLKGFVSQPLKRVGLGISHLSTGWLEGLRGEDIERLPESQAAYLEAAPVMGRIETFSTGVRALGLGVHDLITAPLWFGAELVGIERWRTSIYRTRRNARIQALGPEPTRAQASDD